MAPLTLFFETLSKSLAAGLDLPLGFQLPPFSEEEILKLDLSLIRQVKVVGGPRYEVQNLSGWAARAAVGSAGSVLAQANGFSIDETGTILSDTLNLNTVGIAALAADAQVSFELIFTSPDGDTYRRKFPVRIEKAVFTAAAIITPPTDVALTRLEAERLFMKREGGPGEGFILQSEDTLKKAFVRLHNDGSLKTSPVT